MQKCLRHYNAIDQIRVKHFEMQTYISTYITIAANHNEMKAQDDCTRRGLGSKKCSYAISFYFFPK